MSELPFQVKITCQSWDEEKEKYVKNSDEDYSKYLFSLGGFEFGGVNVSMYGFETWDDGNLKIFFRTLKTCEEISKSGIPPARILSKFPNDPVPETRSLVVDRKTFSHISDEDWEQRLRPEIDRNLDQPASYAIILDGRFPTQLELYASSTSTYPDRLVFEFVGSGIGEGASAHLS